MTMDNRKFESGKYQGRTWEEIRMKKPKYFARALWEEDDEELQEFVKYCLGYLCAKSSELVIYTDGSCERNGQKKSKAGYGVYFGEDDERNSSGKVEGAQTNIRAEMTAAIMAMRAVLEHVEDERIVIATDSEFVVKGMTQWMEKWKENDWKKSDDSPPKNLELWKELDKLSRKIKKKSQKIEWRWVKGHDGNPGNEAADKLARDGANS